jgi:hypothetical protein
VNLDVCCVYIPNQIIMIDTVLITGQTEDFPDAKPKFHETVEEVRAAFAQLDWVAGECFDLTLLSSF